MWAIVAFIERATTEPKIQTILDKIRKLAMDTSNRDTNMDEKITQIKASGHEQWEYTTHC